MSSPVLLREMRQSDVPAAVEIEQSAYPQPWSEKVFRDELNQPNRTYLVAVTDHRVVGYGGVMVVGDEAHITTVVVHPEHRGRRIGTRIMLGLVDAARRAGAKSLTLEVRVSNLPAQRLYQRFGMVPVGVRKQYYSDEDGLVMWVHDIDREDYSLRLDSIREELTGCGR